MDHPGFLAAYAQAAGVAPRPPVLAGSIAAAIEAYRRSDDFRGLAPSTRDQTRRILDRFGITYGPGKLKELGRDHIKADLNRHEGHAANNRLKVWRRLFAWAVEDGRLTSDPSEGIKRKKVAASDGHVPWSPEDVARFRGQWPIGTAERLAFELIFWTGARVSDAVRLGEGNVDAEGWLAFRQQKTGGEVWVPYERDLPDFAAGMAGDIDHLRAAVAARADRHITFLTTTAGKARSVKAVSQWFAGKARAAGVEGKTAHRLRKSRAIALVEAEATTHQVGAWTGHESLAEIEHYTKRFDRRKALTKRKQNGEVPTPPIKFQKRP